MRREPAGQTSREGSHTGWYRPSRLATARGLPSEVNRNVFTYHADQLNESQAELDVDCFSHVFYGPNQLVVAKEQVGHQPLLVL